MTTPEKKSDSWAPTPAAEQGAPKPPEYPKAMYHKDSKPGALISKIVANAEEEKALGAGWGDHESLDFDTAPDEATAAKQKEDADKAAKKP